MRPHEGYIARGSLIYVALEYDVIDADTGEVVTRVYDSNCKQNVTWTYTGDITDVRTCTSKL